jgi:hypothetical protein
MTPRSRQRRCPGISRQCARRPESVANLSPQTAQEYLTGAVSNDRWSFLRLLMAHPYSTSLQWNPVPVQSGQSTALPEAAAKSAQLVKVTRPCSL